MSAIFRRGLTWWVDLRRYGQGRRSLETRDKREAQVRARAAERAAWEGRISDPRERGGVTLAEAYERAWREHKGWRLAKSPKTIGIHGSALMARFGGTTKLGDVDRPKVSEWVQSMEKAGLSGSTINARLTILRVLREVCEMDPLKMPSTGKARKRERVVSDAELSAMQSHFDYDMGTLVVFLRETGARLGEALKATGEDLRPSIPAIVLSDSKTGKPRTLPLTRRTLALLGGRPTHGKLWPGLTGSIVAKRWAAARAAIGITDPDFVVHALRHTRATELVERHGMAVAKAWLGHSSLATTDRYTHLDVKGIIDLEERHTRDKTVPEESVVSPPVSIARR